MKFTTIALVGAFALGSSMTLAQAAGPGGTTGASGTSAAAPASGSAPGATTGQAKAGAMGNPNMPTNPSGNSLINESPSGSTLDQTGTGSGTRK